ncbi:hypothetical protein JHK85_036863 [Glycine max]|nr:hypothetical protein JHK85_036863 [Glycine max]
MGPRQCQVCNQTQSKYKCPSSAVSESFVEKPLVADESSEVLQKFQLEAIASSSEIRDALNDEALQELICRIDGSSNAENELDKAMAEEAFRLFTDKVMLYVASDVHSPPLHVIPL